MATPYFQLRLDSVPSTQDVARERFDTLPLLVIASGQTQGRGRSGAEWLTADRALAASIAFRPAPEDDRPISLMAGLAAARCIPGTLLKWPNDVLRSGLKVGGILVERIGDLAIVGLGLNLWWSQPADGAGALHIVDPGADAHAELGALWGAELMDLVESQGWPLDEYRSLCDTLDRSITWMPEGSGVAEDIAPDGSLLVTVGDGRVEQIRSGAVRHVR